MQNMNGFRVWDKEEKKMYPCNVGKNPFVVDCCGNLFKVTKYGNDRHLDDRTIQLIPVYIALNKYVVMLYLDREDMSCRKICEGDIIRYPTGWEFVVAFGTHPAYCHGDHMDTVNEGFFGIPYKDREDGKLLTTEGFCALVYEREEVQHRDSYPLSDLEDFALVVGNIFQGYYENKKGQ